MNTARIVGWALPILSMTIGTVMTYREYSRLQVAKESLDTAERELGESQTTLDLARRQAAAPRFYAAAPANPAEQSVFLDDLRRRAVAAGVSMQSWRAGTAAVKPPPPANPESAPPLTPEEALLKDVERVTSDLQLSGSYARLRSFLGSFSRSDRLYTVSRVEWQRAPDDQPGSLLSMTVSRYVLTPTAVSAVVKPVAAPLP